VLSSAAPVFNENFDGVTPGLYTAPAVAGNFQVVGGSIDIVGPLSYPGFSCTLPTAVNCTDMNGNVAGTLNALISFAPGIYRLSFNLIGSQRPTAGPANGTVQLGSLVGPQVFSYAWNEVPGLQSFVFTVPTAQNAMLSFSTTTAGATGLLLDNVLIQDITVPEPDTYALLSVGILLLGASRLRARRT
jgi:hypothetical protein